MPILGQGESLFPHATNLCDVTGFDHVARTKVDETINRAGGAMLLGTGLVRRIKSENYRFILE
ncbi:MAG: hypothetical protein E2O36_05290 [Proteobacteria bacterium]|nr:MAG: hypothetical protein E2O36_05290 [Pseudomonadota bacterium]